MLERAWSLLELKYVDDDQRIVEGIASTPTPDRAGHVMAPEGAQFTLPLPLLWQHRQAEPIGEVYEAKVQKDGIHIKARVAKVTESGRLKERVDDAWQHIKTRLVKGLSIGWSPVEAEPVPGTDHVKFTKWIWAELSAVTIPMNTQATILAVKSADLAATGHTTNNLPGVTGLSQTAVKAARRMTIPEQIAQFENKRAASSARMNELMTVASGAGVTLDADQSNEYDGLAQEIKSIDAHLVRLKTLETANVVAATPLAGVKTVEGASNARGGMPVVSVRSNVPKGTAFTRYVMAKIQAKGSVSDAIRIVESNQQWMDQTPEVLLALKAVVNPGTIAEPAWAAPLAVTRPMQDEFLELLRPMTLLGQISGLRNVPFNVSVPVQSGGGTYAWVGEGAPKPVGNLQLASVTLGVAKAAGIIIISEELAKISSPSAEAVVRNDMLKGMAQYLDQQFITPTVAAVTNVSPAAITNLANGYATAGTSATNGETDIKAAVALMTGNNYPISELSIILSESNAFVLAAAKYSTGGAKVFPDLTAKGGAILGIPAFTSQSAGSVVATIHAPSILYADDGGVSIDVSREASVELNTVPTSPVTASSAFVSLWQSNLIGLRAERFINWKRARTTAVVYTTATYV